ncbi:MAG: CRISPR-associated endonuclease Cas3'', partial [Planctomycetes bacterium]|nr:CRISPR-associated endonuclease Cas3'' [Planctomycetota bacterium]
HCTAEADRIIVATQVVEAGVDISAGSLVTDLAPWSSLVQRFGRAARYGGHATVTVLVPPKIDDADEQPYDSASLRAAQEALQKLQDVSLGSLETFEAELPEQQRNELYPYAPAHLLLRREYDELFDTTPDLTGADLDIARFIRSGDERDCLVFWDEVPSEQPAPPADRRPRREELCPVPFLLLREWLCGRESRSQRQPRLRAWVWDWIDGAWKDAAREALLPGRVVCVDAAWGGYLPERGFAPDAKARVPVLPPSATQPAFAALQEAADDSQDGENLSIAQWKTIATHGAEVADEAAAIAKAMQLPQPLIDLLRLVGRWHDVGKAHPAFQSRIDPRASGHPDRVDLAKAPAGAWLRSYRCADGERRGFRHELASALALFALLEQCRPDHPALLGPWRQALAALGHPWPQPSAQVGGKLAQDVLALSSADFDLLAYLVAAHHGKVRVALHAAPADQDFVPPKGDSRGLPIRGLREGDVLPSLLLDPQDPPLPELTLTLAPATLGLSPRTGRSWRERTLGLQERFGPAALAWLEALIVAADRRASRWPTPCPLVQSSRMHAAPPSGASNAGWQASDPPLSHGKTA